MPYSCDSRAPVSTPSPQSSMPLPRWWWPIAFALALLVLSSRGFAHDTSTVPFNSVPLVELPHSLQLDAVHGPVPLEATQSGEPESVELLVHDANLDRDALPDGWIAAVVLRDANGRHVIARANAVFELRPGRLTLDGATFIAGNAVVQRWSESLNFDQQGIAQVRLPQQNASTPWPSVSSSRFPGTYARQRLAHTSRLSRSSTGSIQPSMNGRHHFDRDRSRDLLAPHRSSDLVGADFPFYPTHGVLTVRVSVPTHGTFDAASVVPLRPMIVNIAR